MVTDILRNEGYTVFTASGTTQGLVRLKESRPDLIIMDNGLQSNGDKDAMRQIRQISYLPVLVLGRHQETIEALERGADAFLSRPPNLIELKARVKALLRRSTSRNLRLDDRNGPVNGSGLSGGAPTN